MKRKIFEVHTEIRTLDNVKQPVIHFGNNKKRKSTALVKNLLDCVLLLNGYTLHIVEAE